MGARHDLGLTTLRLSAMACEARNIARASELPSRVGSTISKRRAQLEDHVGTQLPVRRRHGLDPTRADEALLEQAPAMLESSQRIERDVAASAADLRGLQSHPHRNGHLAMGVRPSHPLADETSVRFGQTLDFDQVSLPVSSARRLTMAREAAALARLTGREASRLNGEKAIQLSMNLTAR